MHEYLAQLLIEQRVRKLRAEAARGLRVRRAVRLAESNASAEARRDRKVPWWRRFGTASIRTGAITAGATR